MISSNNEEAIAAESVASGRRSGRRRTVSVGTARSMSSQILGLSLFIMLLAFFIVLNAISSYEVAKVRPVLQSLGHVFASRLQDEPVQDEPSITQSEDTSINEGETTERLQALFNAQLPGHEAVVNQRDGTMYVKVSFEEFEQAVMALGQYDAADPQQAKKQEGVFLKGFFLPTLVSLMRRDIGKVAYRMDMILNIDENPASLQNSQPKRMADLMKSMGDIAGKIEGAGLSKKYISAGLQKGEPGTIELMFRYHIPFDPALPEDVETDGTQPAESGGADE